MSVTVSFSPVGRGDQAMRWARALDRAKSAGIQVVSLDQERFVVTSATVPGIAYIATPTTCGCAAAQRGDSVCLHRAAVKNMLAYPPDPESPSTAEIGRDQHEVEVAKQYQRKTLELLSELNVKLERGGNLSDRDYERSLRLQERELEGHDSLVAAKKALAALVSAAQLPAIA